MTTAPSVTDLGSEVSRFHVDGPARALCNADTATFAGVVVDGVGTPAAGQASASLEQRSRLVKAADHFVAQPLRRLGWGCVWSLGSAGMRGGDIMTRPALATTRRHW